MKRIVNKTPSFTIQFLKDGSAPENPIWDKKIQCYEEDAYVQPKSPFDFVNEYKDNSKNAK